MSFRLLSDETRSAGPVVVAFAKSADSVNLSVVIVLTVSETTIVPSLAHVSPCQGRGMHQGACGKRRVRVLTEIATLSKTRTPLVSL